MSNKFKAIVLNQSGDQFLREVQTVDKSFLKDRDVLTKIDYSDLNFKDAMILNNISRVTRKMLINIYPKLLQK